MGTKRGVGRRHAAVDQLERGVLALVEDLDFFLGERNVDLKELRDELKLLFDLRLRDVEVLALGVGTADQAVIPAICYSSPALYSAELGHSHFCCALMLTIRMRPDYRTTLSIICRGLFA